VLSYEIDHQLQRFHDLLTEMKVERMPMNFGKRGNRMPISPRAMTEVRYMLNIIKRCIHRSSEMSYRRASSRDTNINDVTIGHPITIETKHWVNTCQRFHLEHRVAIGVELPGISLKKTRSATSNHYARSQKNTWRIANEHE
jgi:hypothetical protein